MQDLILRTYFDINVNNPFSPPSTFAQKLLVILEDFTFLHTNVQVYVYLFKFHFHTQPKPDHLSYLVVVTSPNPWSLASYLERAQGWEGPSSH